MRAALSLVLILGSCAAPAERPVEERWYRMSGPLDSWMIQLSPDGRFRTLFVTHFTVQEGLKGTWRPAGEEEARLRCDRWARMIVSGPLRVRFGRPWEEQRPRIRKGLEDFLRAHPAAAFSKDEVEEAVTWPEEREGLAATVMPLSSLEERVSRADLQALLPLLEAYGGDGDPRLVRARFFSHRGVEVLEWVDWSGYTDPLSSAEIRARIESAAPGETIPDVWVRIPAAEAERRLDLDESLRFFKESRRGK